MFNTCVCERDALYLKHGRNNNNRHVLAFVSFRFYEIEGICKALGLDHNAEDFTEEKEEELWQLVQEMPVAFEFIVNLTFDSFLNGS